MKTGLQQFKEWFSRPSTFTYKEHEIEDKINELIDQEAAPVASSGGRTAESEAAFYLPIVNESIYESVYITYAQYVEYTEIERRLFIKAYNIAEENLRSQQPAATSPSDIDKMFDKWADAQCLSSDGWKPALNRTAFHNLINEMK